MYCCPAPNKCSLCVIEFLDIFCHSNQRKLVYCFGFLHNAKIHWVNLFLSRAEKVCEIAQGIPLNSQVIIFFCLGTVHDIVNRGGRCLIPVFALGRAQELLLILGRQNTLFNS